MPSKVFISYRREDAKWPAREIYGALKRVLPADHVFMDIDSIPIGVDYVEFLEGWVDRCDIMLALIGAGWADAVDPETGRRRLENPNDFVRIEVRKGLARGIPVVPILLDGARPPGAAQLPDDLVRLARRNAEFIDHRTVDTDVDRLIRRLRLTEQPAQAAPSKPVVASPTVASVEAEGRIKVDATFIEGAPSGWFKPGAGKSEWFKDHEAGPEMVVVPAGSFTMGSPADEPDRESWQESPQHKVVIAQPFAVARHAITCGEFAAFVTATGHEIREGARVRKDDQWVRDPKMSWRAPGFVQDESHPVVCINWHDAKAYAAWLSQITGKPYRLLSEAEREYVTRASTTTPFWWGSSITPDQANYDGSVAYQGGGGKGEWRKSTAPIGSFQANPWGLFNVHGNVWEWCEDVWHDNYSGAPVDGAAWLQDGDVSLRVVRGGSWSSNPHQDLRAAYRGWLASDFRGNAIGFRLARTLNP
jgi:formylglycine-generating enzyme required for sulfatase activity